MDGQTAQAGRLIGLPERMSDDVVLLDGHVLAEVSLSSVTGPETKWFSLAIFLAALGLWLYARWMRKARVLR